MISITIDFDDERDLVREEVDDELPNDLLPPEASAQALTTNGGPE